MKVAIVGAGPAGAALALLLARRGLSVVLLERHTDFAREFRGEGLLPGGVDALQQMGLGAALDALPQSRVDRVEIYQEKRRVLAVEIPESSCEDRKSTRLNSSHFVPSRMPSSA